MVFNREGILPTLMNLNPLGLRHSRREMSVIAASAPIEDLDLSLWAFNSLRASGIYTIAQLAVNTVAEVEAMIRGDRSRRARHTDEIRFALHRNGRFLKDDAP